MIKRLQHYTVLEECDVIKYVLLVFSQSAKKLNRISEVSSLRPELITICPQVECVDYALHCGLATRK